MQRNSIQRRLIVAVLMSQLVLAAGLVAAGVYFTHQQLQTAFDAALHEHATTVAALVRYPEESDSSFTFEPSMVPASIDSRHRDFYEVRLQSGKVLAHSANWPGSSLDLSDKQYWNSQVSGIPYRAVRLRDVPILDREGNESPPVETLTVIYGAPISGIRAASAHAGLYIGLASIALLGATGMLALWRIRRAFTPLRDLTVAAAKITPHQWDFNPPPGAATTAELAPLTEAMTAMLDGLRGAFEQQREFIGNAAHELKTPVAVLKSSLQSVLQRPRTPEEYRARTQEALEDVARLEKLVHSMLRLARAEQWAAAGHRRVVHAADLSETCSAAIDRLQGLIDARHIKVEFAPADLIRVEADAEDLEVILVNLLENAVQYSGQGSTVRVSSCRVNGQAVVSIVDHGSGIPAEDLPHIFDRFHRGDASRARDTGGFGLGLAIAKALTETYGGTITASSKLGEGTDMKVALPLN